MKGIVDCNSFYCSCERVFRPDLKETPIVVLSNNDGCVISRDDKAKELGLGMTGPYYQVKPLIEKHGVEVFSSNYNLYGDMSRRVMEVLKMFVGEENVEVYSVDEAFLHLEGFKPEQLEQLSNHIRDTIERWTGIRVSVGIAPNKTLSKLANRIAKKNKELTQCVHLLDTEEKIIEALKNTNVGNLWGVGSRYADKLTSVGILTAWDLRNLPPEWIRKYMGGVVGVRLVKELHGEVAIAMKEELAEKKAIATTRMFGAAVTELKDIKEAVATYAARVGEKLRRQRSAASTLSVFLVPQEKAQSPYFKHGPTSSAYTLLPSATSLSHELIKPAVQLAEQLFEQGKRYKKAGVMVSGLVPDGSIQSNIFHPQTGISRHLMQKIDNINFSMRGDVVKFASSGMSKDWKMRQEFHSPRYTTRWEQLCKVN